MVNQEVKPTIFKDEAQLALLKEKFINFQYIDAFERQLKELFFIDNKQYIGTDKETAYQTDDFKKYCESKKDDFNYIFYPWNQTIVKCAKINDFLTLKTNRNQDLITSAEQEILRNFKIGVFGMSVGSNIAYVLTQAGISNKIAVADFDELDTTNLNRILAGTHQIGLNKTLIAARRIYEDNPYAEVTTFDKGINVENLEKLLANKEIDCIIEEIDEMTMKIETRKLALKYKVPVVMITDNGDGVVLHIERYDLGYDKIFEKDEAYWQQKLSGPMGKELAGDIIINDIVGGIHQVDPKMIASVGRVMKKELVSWSQLGSAAILGGVVATYAIKQIAVGDNRTFFVREYVLMPKF